MNNAGGIALTSHASGDGNMWESVEVLNEIPLNGLALEQVKRRGAEEPEDDVDEVGPPEDSQLRPAHQKQTFIEEEQCHLDAGKEAAHENHGDPDVLFSFNIVSQLR